MADFRIRRAVTGPWTTRIVLPLLLSGLVFGIAIPCIALAQNAQAERPNSGMLYADFIAQASRRFDIPERWIRAVMRAESDSDAGAHSSKGAMGLMQIMPATWDYLRLRHHLGDDPYDPCDNILAGTAYLRELYDRYGSPGFLAAYNAGPGRYDDYLKTGRPLPAETRAYVDALEPQLHGKQVVEIVDAADNDSSGWPRASLFVTRSGGSAVVVSETTGRRIDDATATIRVHDVTAIAPMSGDLFVVRNKIRREK